jgi:hypothetical protein
MNFTTRKLLISSLCAFMICLIASTATTVVCAEEPYVEEPYWGNLKAGDEMRWHYVSPSPMVLYPDVYYELEILELQGESLKVDYHRYGVTYYEEIGTIKRGTATWTSDRFWPWIYPAALIQENEDVKATTYEYNGSTYIAAYLEWYDESDFHYEYWWDYHTGIFLRGFSKPGDYSYGFFLQHTNAILSTPEMGYYSGNQTNRSLETIVIALVVVVLVVILTVVTYRLARYKPE